MAHNITHFLAQEEVNLREFVATGLQGKAIIYLATDSPAEAEKALGILRRINI